MKSITKRRRGYTRLSSKRQVSIPLQILKETGLEAGDELKVELDDGKIVLIPSLSLGERRVAAIEATAGSMTGIFRPGDLDRLRAEWR